MIEIGVQTKGLIPEKPLEVALGMIADAGFTRVDYNLDTYLKNTAIYGGKINKFFDNTMEDLVLYFAAQRQEMDRHGIAPSQMHAPYPYYVNGKSEQNDYMMTNTIPKSIIIAEALGAPWVVVHPAKMQYVHGLEEEHKVNFEYFKALIPILKQCKVGLCVENLYEGIGTRIVEGTCSNPDDAIWYVDRLNEEAGEEIFGICLDTGHLQLTKRNAADYISKVGQRLKILHLHENDASGDLHQMPYSFGAGRQDGLDWDEVADALRGIGFDGTLNFETFPCMNSFIKGMEFEVLETIHAIGEYLKNRIER